MSRLTWTLSPKPASEYTLGQLETLIDKWGGVTGAAAAINVSLSSFRRAVNNKKKVRAHE